MSANKNTWADLEAAVWCKSPAIASMNDKSASFQELKDGKGPIKKDSYSTLISSMPAKLTAEEYLAEFAKSPNTAVNSSMFNRINRFEKRLPGRLALGDIWDIDILGPDNGSIVLVDFSDGLGKMSLTSAWITIQTISCDKTGDHPECGAREFGFERKKSGVAFYTRGVSRASSHVHRTGTPVQHQGWMAMVRGIRDEIKRRGGTIPPNSIHAVRA